MTATLEKDGMVTRGVLLSLVKGGTPHRVNIRVDRSQYYGKYHEWREYRLAGKLTVPALPTTFHQFRQLPYPSLLDEDMLETNFSPFYPQPIGIFKLERYSVIVPGWWPVPSKCTSRSPTYIYYEALQQCGQYQIANDLLLLLSHQREMFDLMCQRGQVEMRMLNKAHGTYSYYDDFLRKDFKRISSYCFPKVFTHGPAYILFCHIHSLFAKAPYTVEQIKEDIHNWVGDTIDGQPKKLSPTVYSDLDNVFERWAPDPLSKLSFRHYCNDVFRWGTGGGAPKTEFLGTTYRTKWAWALSRIQDSEGKYRESVDLYEDSLKEKQVCEVALKEEAQKTREIITTPLSSYLRQCYLLYRRKNIELSSPISSSRWVREFETLNPKWYGAVDGEHFDWSIPKDVVIYFIQQLGNLDDETSAVAKAEIEHLQNLHLNWRNNLIKWKGGLLSGWRITSILGTLISYCAYLHICRVNGVTGAMDYGALGDDLILYSNTTKLTTEQLVDAYNSFGLKSNKNKTIVGRRGEFLRKVISEGGSWGYPALGLRTVLYANPWISDYKFEYEADMANGWLTFLSRMNPHCVTQSNLKSYVLHRTLDNLRSRFGTYVSWERFLGTPSSASGAGTTETMNNQWYAFVKPGITTRVIGKGEVVPELVGMLKPQKILRSRPYLMPFKMEYVRKLVKKITDSGDQNFYPQWRKDVNITQCVYKILNDDLSIRQINEWLTIQLPYHMRNKGGRVIVRYLLIPLLKSYPILSAQHSKESQAAGGDWGNKLMAAILNSRRFVKNAELGAAVSLYTLEIYRDVMAVYSTW